MTLCPNCHNEYKNICRHWDACGYPNLSKKQQEILIGCLMGDATIGNRNGKRNRNPRFVLVNTNTDYADYVHDKLQPFANKFSVKTDEKYRAQARVTVTHPWLENLSKWYNSGQKVFPENLHVTPTILKHWYCCDGHMDRRERFTIAIENEKDNGQKISDYFDKIGFEIGTAGGQLYANPDVSKKIFEYMGSPPPGFGYKWP